MATEKEYQNIYAYKPKESFGYFIVLIMYFIFTVLCCFGLVLSIFFIIGIVVTSIIWGWALFTLVKNKLMPHFVFTQKDEDLIIFPDTRNIVVPLKEIVTVDKKHIRGRYGQNLPYGKIIIITKNNIYKLKINDLDRIFLRLENNLKISKDYVGLC